MGTANSASRRVGQDALIGEVDARRLAFRSARRPLRSHRPEPSNTGQSFAASSPKMEPASWKECGSPSRSGAAHRTCWATEGNPHCPESYPPCRQQAEIDRAGFPRGATPPWDPFHYSELSERPGFDLMFGRNGLAVKCLHPRHRAGAAACQVARAECAAGLPREVAGVPRARGQARAGAGQELTSASDPI